FRSYLLGFMLWLGITLGSMAILMIQHMTGGKWGMVIRRQLEAAVKCLPLMALLFIPIIAGMPYLYGTWLHPEAKNKHLVDLSHVLDGRDRAHSFELCANCLVAESKRGARSRQADAHIRDAVGVLQLLAVANYLGGKSAVGNQFLHQAVVFRLAGHCARAGGL